VELKAMIQWIAASAADRPVEYHHFGDPRIAKLPDVVRAMQQLGGEMNCKNLYNLIQNHSRGDVFTSILKKLEGG